MIICKFNVQIQCANLIKASTNVRTKTMRKHLSFLPVLLLSIALPSGLILTSAKSSPAASIDHLPHNFFHNNLFHNQIATKPPITETKQRIPENVLRACLAAISTMVGQNAQLTSNTLRIYTVSNTEESLRGRGNVTVADGSVQPFEFNCKFTPRTDVVTGTDYRFLNAPTTAVASASNSAGNASNNSGNNAGTGRTAIVETPERTCLNLRTGPGTNNQAMSCAAYGSSVTLNGNNSGEWAQLTSGLWAYRPYLR
jgi:hypothetical protein